MESLTAIHSGKGSPSTVRDGVAHHVEGPDGALSLHPLGGLGTKIRNCFLSVDALIYYEARGFFCRRVCRSSTSNSFALIDLASHGLRALTLNCGNKVRLCAPSIRGRRDDQTSAENDQRSVSFGSKRKTPRVQLSSSFQLSPEIELIDPF